MSPLAGVLLGLLLLALVVCASVRRCAGSRDPRELHAQPSRALEYTQPTSSLKQALLKAEEGEPTREREISAADEDGYRPPTTSKPSFGVGALENMLQKAYEQLVDLAVKNEYGSLQQEAQAPSPPPQQQQLPAAPAAPRNSTSKAVSAPSSRSTEPKRRVHEAQPPPPPRPPLAPPPPPRLEREPSHDESLYAAFQAADADGSGALSKRQLYAALALVGLHVKASEQLQLWRMFDRDTNGRVDYHEFRQLGVVLLEQGEAHARRHGGSRCNSGAMRRQQPMVGSVGLQQHHHQQHQQQHQQGRHGSMFARRSQQEEHQWQQAARRIQRLSRERSDGRLRRMSLEAIRRKKAEQEARPRTSLPC